MKEYVIKSRRNFDYIEEYEKNSQNVLEIKVIDYQGNIIRNIKEINMTFGNDAILGLGTELIRIYMNQEKLNGLHLSSPSNGYVSEALGICVSPNTPDLVFQNKELNIDDLMNNTKNQDKNIMDFTALFEWDNKTNEKIREFVLNDSILYGCYNYNEISIIKLSSDKFLMIFEINGKSTEFSLNVNQILELL